MEVEDKEVDWKEWRGKARADSGRREKQKKVYCMATAGIVPCPLVQQKPTLSLQVDARRYFLNCEAFNTSLLYFKRMCYALP